MRKSVTNYASVTGLAVLLALGGLNAVASESKLSQKPIPLQSEAYSVFAVEDIANYESLLGKLKAAADAPDTPAGRIWSFLSPSLREELSGLGEAGELEENVKYRMINGLNAVVRNHTLYDSTVWDPASLPEDLRADFEAGLDTLAPADGTARNRELVRLTFPDEILKSQVEPFVHRPRTLRIFGDPFLGNGSLSRGIKLPTGAIWQPSLFAFGSLRTAWQYEQTGNRLPPITDAVGPPIDRGESKVEELVTGLDLFFNLALSPTERVLLQLRPLERDDVYDGYRWQTAGLNQDDGWYLRGDADVEQLFFEGDFGELFPRFDRADKHTLDFGFSIGRQSLVFQNGIMLNDNVDAFGLVRNNILVGKAANLRLTGIWGWDGLDRGVGATSRRRDSASLLGLFTAMDFPEHTVEFDLAYVNDEVSRRYLNNRTIQYEGGDQFNVGLSFIQRIGHINTSFRINHSERIGDRDTIHADSGTLYFLEASLTPTGTLDHLYGTLFYNNEHYTSVARDPSTGGPLGQAGILFASPVLGSLGAPIENSTNSDTVGGAIGYQKFFGIRRQLILEAGGRKDTDGIGQGRLGVMARYEQAFLQHYIWRLDAYYVTREDLDDKRGIRAEFVVQF